MIIKGTGRGRGVPLQILRPPRLQDSRTKCDPGPPAWQIIDITSHRLIDSSTLNSHQLIDSSTLNSKTHESINSPISYIAPCSLYSSIAIQLYCEIKSCEIKSLAGQNSKKSNCENRKYTKAFGSRLNHK